MSQTASAVNLLPFRQPWIALRCLRYLSLYRLPARILYNESSLCNRFLLRPCIKFGNVHADPHIAMLSWMRILLLIIRLCSQSCKCSQSFQLLYTNVQHDTGPSQNPTGNTRSRAFNEARDWMSRRRSRASRCVSRRTGRSGCHHRSHINHFTYTTRWRMKQYGKIYGIKWAVLLCLSLSPDAPVVWARAVRRSPFVEVASIRRRTIVRGVALSQMSSSELAHGKCTRYRVIYGFVTRWIDARQVAWSLILRRTRWR